MTVPTYADKHGEPAVLTPERHLRDRDLDPDRLPDAIVLTYQSSVLEAAADAAVATDPLTFATMHVLESNGDRVGVIGDFGVGAPVTALVVEVLAALGVDTVLVLGGAGAIQPDISGEEALVIEDAIRDEGVSHHYLEPARTVAATPAVVDALERALDDAGIDHRAGRTWTTDALYRETVPEVEHYADEGVLAVEMEVAALFALAHYRDFDAGALLAPFDRVSPDGWVRRIDGAPQLARLLPVATAALTDHAGREK